MMFMMNGNRQQYHNMVVNKNNTFGKNRALDKDEVLYQQRKHTNETKLLKGERFAFYSNIVQGISRVKNRELPRLSRPVQFHVYASPTTTRTTTTKTTRTRTRTRTTMTTTTTTTTAKRNPRLRIPKLSSDPVGFSQLDTRSESLASNLRSSFQSSHPSVLPFAVVIVAYQICNNCCRHLVQQVHRNFSACFFFHSK